MKFFLWLGKMALASVMIASLTVFVTWTAVQTYLDKVLAHYQLGEGIGKIEFSDLLSEMTSSLNIMKQPAAGGEKSKDAAGNTSVGSGGSNRQTTADAGHSTEPDGENLAAAAAAAGQSDSSQQSGTGTGAGGTSPSDSGGASGHAAGAGSAGTDTGSRTSAGGGGASGGGSGNGNGGTSPDTGAATRTPEEPDHTGDAVPVWSQTGSKVNSDASGAGKKLAVSSDSFQSIKDKISNDDKIKLFSLLVTKLPEQDVQTISQLVEDGITNDELNQIDTIIQKSLSKEEYKEVLAILQKYE